MDERVQLFLRETGPVLCIDIGGETQNALLARPGTRCEDWPRFTLPSRSCLVAQRVRELRLLKCGCWLYGCEMGGGFLRAIKEHLASGLKVAATAEAARSIHDNQEVVEKMGVEISAFCPNGYVPVHCGDYDPGFWSATLRHACLPQPHFILAAAQDHGRSLKGNRQARMAAWERSLKENPDPLSWIHLQAPDNLTRLQSLQKHTGGPVADTAASAILGALCDQQVFERSCREGITIIHAGNFHTLGALVRKGKVLAIFEHHTEKQNMNLLMENLNQFKKRWLPTEKVYNEGGHGTAYACTPDDGESFDPTYIFGPCRDLLKNEGIFIAPHGDMSVAGCFGLLYGWSRAHARV